MSIYRCHKLLLFWFVIGVCGLNYVRARQDNTLASRSCRANGEYCQMHMECCSRKCMTYMYKCAPKASDTYGNPTVYNYLQQSWWPMPVNKPTKEELEIITLDDIKPTITTDSNDNNSQSVEKADNENEMITKTSNTIHTTNRTCKLVGDFCSDGRDCCTMRCHTYLHKCVT